MSVLNWSGGCSARGKKINHTILRKAEFHMAQTRDFGGVRSRIIVLLFLTLCVRLIVAKDSYITHEDAERLVKRSSAWWFANIPRQGTVAYGNSSWVLFRNVADFGAVGTASQDDVISR
jgi:hypothetical protein